MLILCLSYFVNTMYYDNKQTSLVKLGLKLCENSVSESVAGFGEKNHDNWQAIITP